MGLGPAGVESMEGSLPAQELPAFPEGMPLLAAEEELSTQADTRKAVQAWGEARSPSSPQAEEVLRPPCLLPLLQWLSRHWPAVLPATELGP